MAAAYDEYLWQLHWRETRKKALKRAGYRCEKCENQVRLHVHHKTYARLGQELDGDLLALCTECHNEAHGIPEQ